MSALAALTTPGFDPATLPGVMLALDNRGRLEQAIVAAWPDRSPSGRAFAPTNSPLALPRHHELGGQPVLSLEGLLQQRLADVAADAAAFADPFRLAGHWIFANVELRGQSNGGETVNALIGSWDAGTSNQNGYLVYFTGSQLVVAVTSTTGGGTAHIFAQTAPGAIKNGDVLDFVFIHNTDKTWTWTIRRRARTPTDNGGAPTTIVLSGSYASTINAATAPNGLTVGATHNGLHFGSWTIHALAMGAVRPTTAADAAAFLAWERGLCDFPWQPYDAEQPLLRASDFSDPKHQNDSGQGKLHLLTVAGQNALALALGLASIRFGKISDSRGMDTSASAPATTAWTSLDAGASYVVPRTEVGPALTTAGRATFAVGGATTRSNAPTAQRGHSQRTHDLFSLDNYVGPPPAAYDDVNTWCFFIDVNDLGGAYYYYDMPDELLRMVEYQVQYKTAPRIGVVLLTPPITLTTTTGYPQQLIRSRLRAYHAIVPRIRALGVRVWFGNTNDGGDNPS